MKKDFDETLSHQLREIYAYYYQQTQGIEEIFTLIQDNSEAIQLLSNTLPWSTFYELPYRTFLAILILEFNLTDIVENIAASEDHLQSSLENMKKLDETYDGKDELSDEEKAFRFSLIIALFNQLSSMSIHSHPLSNLIEKVREGNDEALFNAVLIDQSIVSSPTVAYRIQVAQIKEDGNFLDLLSKAIKGSRPKRNRPDKDLDHLRYMLEVVDEEIGINNITREKLHNILAKDLELYDHDSLGGFKKVIQRRNKRYRT